MTIQSIGRRHFLRTSLVGAAGLRVFGINSSEMKSNGWVLKLGGAPSSAEKIAANHICEQLREMGNSCRILSQSTPLPSSTQQVLVGTLNNFPELRKLVEAHTSTAAIGQEGYFLLWNSDKRTIAVSSATPRGVLYGAYDLCRRLRVKGFNSSFADTEKPALQWRWISSPAMDMPFYRELIMQHAPDCRLNLVHIYSAFTGDDLGDRPNATNSYRYYMAQPLWYRKYPKLFELRKDQAILHQAIANMKELSTLAAERDLLLLYILPIVQYYNVPSNGPRATEHREFLRLAYPDWFKTDGNLDFLSPKVQQFVADQVSEFFELFPDLGGLLGHTGEMATFSPSIVKEETALNAAVAACMETVYEACQKYGKLLVWDMHSAAGDTRNSDAVVRQAASGKFPSMFLTAESTYTEQEFSLTYPTTFYLNRMVAAAPSIFAQDCFGEGWDYDFIPFIVDQYLVRHFRDCQEAGATGGGVLHYVYEGKYNAFNTVQNVNIELQTRMMWEGGGINPDEVIQQWIEKRFGTKAGPALLPLFKRVNLILSRIFYIAGNGSWGPRHGFPQFSWMLGAPFYFIEFFSPPGTPLVKDWTRRTAKVVAIPMEAMRQEKQEAVDQSKLAQDDLTRLESFLEPAAYRSLLARFSALWYYSRGCQTVLEIGYSFKNAYISHYDSNATDSVTNLRKQEQSLRNIVAEARNDARLQGLEEDVYRFGLERRFLSVTEQFADQLAKEINVRSSPLGA